MLSSASEEEAERLKLLDESRAYCYYISEWLNKQSSALDVVGLQEVFSGGLGFGRVRQRDHYRVIGGFRSAISHRVGFAGFRYENVLLSQLDSAGERRANYSLPCRIRLLAACGFTLMPFLFEGRIVWIGNTHLHPYSPADRARQAERIVREIGRLGDAPVIFIGDFNTVAPGCRDTGFTAGERDATSYKNDNTFNVLSAGGLRMYPHNECDRFYTYPTGLPNRTLDYILFSRHWEVESYRVLTDFTFSDHYPVLGEFRLR